MKKHPVPKRIAIFIMPGFKKHIPVLLLLSIICFSCNAGKAILSKQDFETGNWLLVIDNKADNSLFVVNDRNILKANPLGLIIKPSGECGGTTCDGFIELYKDGELMASGEFLTKSDIIESSSLKAAYKKATTDCIYPSDQKQFKLQWDSLTRLTYYPTRQHVQPQDKDIICFYKY